MRSNSTTQKDYPTCVVCELLNGSMFKLQRLIAFSQAWNSAQWPQTWQLWHFRHNTD